MVRCLWVKDWLPRDEEDVLEEGPLYDSDDPETRTRMDDISDVPLLDQDGAEIRFFTEDGRRVYRRDYRELTEVGALFDLPAAARLCEDGVFEDDYDDDDTLEVEDCRYRLFPHAGLRTVGQWQTEGVFPRFHRVVNEINRDIHSSQVSDPDDHEDAESDDNGDGESGSEDGRDRRPRHHRRVRYGVVEVLSGNYYQSLAHRYRYEGPGNQDLQCGRITAGLLSTHGETTSQKTKGRNIRSKLKLELPHDSFEAKVDAIAAVSLPSSVRLEHVYVIRGARIPEKLRNGK